MVFQVQPYYHSYIFTTHFFKKMLRVLSLGHATFPMTCRLSKAKECSVENISAPTNPPLGKSNFMSLVGM